MLDWWFYDDHHKVIKSDRIEKLIDDIIDKNYSSHFLIEKVCVEDKRFSKLSYKKIVNNSIYQDEISLLK